MKIGGSYVLRYFLSIERNNILINLSIDKLYYRYFGSADIIPVLEYTQYSCLIVCDVKIHGSRNRPNRLSHSIDNNSPMTTAG